MLTLLESDLPTIIWWQGSFWEKQDSLRSLSAIAEPAIFDSFDVAACSNDARYGSNTRMR